MTVPTGVRHTFSYDGPRGVDSTPGDPLGVSVTDVLAPLARLRGYQGAYARYQQPAFWERHVEQPEL